MGKRTFYCFVQAGIDGKDTVWRIIKRTALVKAQIKNKRVENMISTTSLMEMNKVIHVEHGEPHRVLGMHEVTVKDKRMVSVRAFVPQAKKAYVLDIADEEKRYPMTKIHEDGFFEAVLEDREEWFPYALQFIDYGGNEWTRRDPYSFQPTITEYDRYLFGAGNHYEIYKKLGAHVMEMDGVKGVSFGVWAPNAKSVSVIGSFNSWDERRSQMRVLGQSGIWELFVPGIQELDQYKFQIKAQDNSIVNKSDPYAVYSELRPQTASIVYDIDGYEWMDGQWMDYRQNNDMYNRPVNIYEVHLGSWMRVPEEGDRFLTYLEAADKLVSYVKEMGYTHIELMPIEEHPFDGSWGYQVTGYYAPTSRYGTPKEFMEFVDRCHQNEIGVILDWVPAHFPKDAHGLARFDGTALYEHSDPKKGEHPEWGTLIFNYGRNEVRNFLIANAIYWIEEFHLDGLRVDAVASMLYLDYGKSDGQWIPNQYGGRENLEAVEFLKHMNSVITGRHPGVMMIAEESTSWPGVSRSANYGGLGFSLKWNMGWMNDYLSYMKKDPVYRKYHHNNLTFSMVYAYTENFILVLSHDEIVHGKGSMINKMPGDVWQKFANLRVCYGFMYGHPGKKLLFMGNEFGQYAEWSEARSLDWHLLDIDSHKGLRRYMRDLNHFYLEEPSLWQRDFDSAGFEWIECNDADRSVISFIRKGISGKDDLIFVCNFTPETYFNFRLGVPVAGIYREVFNSDSSCYGGSGVVNDAVVYSERVEWNNRQSSISIQVPPLGVCVFKLK